MAAGGIVPSKVAESVSGGRRKVAGEIRLRSDGAPLLSFSEPDAEGRCKDADASEGGGMTPGNLEVRAASTVEGKGERAGWIFDCGVLVALAFLSFLAGCLVNAFRTDRLPWAYASRAKTMDAAVAGLSERGPAASEPLHEIRLEDFQSFVMEHQGLVLDARAKVFYDLAHVPGAMSLPRETFAEEYPRLRDKLAAYKDRPVAVYCSGADCSDGQLLANALAKLGYRHLLIYTSGWEEWSQTGLPQEGSAAQP